MKHIFKKLHHRSNQDSPSSPSSSASSAVPPSSLSPPTTTTSVTPSPATNRHQIDYYSSEEEYQVQLALALSVSGDDGVSDADRIRTGGGGGGGGSVGSAKERDDAADLLSRRYWDYSVLDFEEKVIDGFYDIYGLSTDTSSQGKMPSLAELETKPGTSNFEVIIVNRRIDHSLEELLQIAHCISLDCSYCEVNVLVQKLAELVTDHLGGPVKDANGILSKWVERSTDLRSSLHTTVLPIGSLKIGLSRHRALLFKVLADNVGLPCRLVKGSHYTGIEDDAVNIIKLENEIEFLVDLMGAPGALIPADILSTTDISSNPQLPPLTKFSNLQINDDSETYYPIPKPLSGKSGNISPSLSNKSGDNEVGSSKSSMFKGVTRMNVNVIPYTQSKKEDPQNLFSDLNPFQMKGTGKSTLQNNQVWNKGEVPWKNRNDLVTGKPPLGWKNRQAHNEVPRKKENDIFVEEFFSRTDSTTSSSASSSDNVSDVVNPDISKLQMSSNDKNPHKNLMGLHDRGKQTHARLGETNMRFGDQFSMNSLIGSRANEIDPIMDDVGECEIPWEDLVIGERIGLGSYGEVYRADWNGTEVAVKKFLDQDFSGDALDEFRREVRIMRRLRHENVVTYMGAVTRPPNLSIITEFLPRGSLYRIIHRPNCQIDEKRRIKMALDVARGMSCLHSSKPTIVHRDLKSPNLLVDNNWRVKVCDFGLSRLKHNTFLSSKSTAGTPEWMAPEVLRNEPSTEKCDIYSFGVILWELATLKMPWSDMNPMQVVGAVGFQNQRLDISKDVDPLVASIISHCWLTDPTKRPSFDDLALALGRLERLVIPSIHDQQDLSLR